MAEDKQTVTVEDYSRSFVQKILCGSDYAECELQAAGKTFYSLLKRLAKDGDREDVRIPFKILKDEFATEWRSCQKAKQDALVQRLFKVLDCVHTECQENLSHSLQGNALSEMILEEFRLRIAKMVIGETWSDILPMRLVALKHMHKYMQQEMEFIKLYSSTHLDNKVIDKPKFSAVGKFVKSLTGPAKNSWSAVFDDLFLMSGEKLAPLLFSLLDENNSLLSKVEELSSKSDVDEDKNHVSPKESLQGSQAGNELGTTEVSVKTSDSSASGSNLIDLQEGLQDKGKREFRIEKSDSEPSGSLAKVQAVLNRITTMPGSAASEESGQEWIAFSDVKPGGKESAQNNPSLRTNSWSPKGRDYTHRFATMRNVSALDRPPMPKNFATRSKDFANLRSGSVSNRETHSPRLLYNLKGISVSQDFDALDPLKK